MSGLFEIDYEYFNLLNDIYFFVLGAALSLLLPFYQDVIVSKAVRNGKGVKLVDIPANLDVTAAMWAFLSSGSKIGLAVSAFLLVMTGCNLGVDVTAPPKSVTEAGTSYTGAAYGDLLDSTDAVRAAITISGKPVNLCELCLDYTAWQPSSIKSELLSDAWQGAIPGVQFSRPTEESRLKLNYVGGFVPEGIDAGSNLWHVPGGSLVEMTEGMYCETVSGIIKASGGEHGIEAPNYPVEYCYPEETRKPLQPRTVKLHHALQARFPVLDDMEGYRLGTYGSRIHAHKTSGTNSGPLLANWKLILRRDGVPIELESVTAVQVGPIDQDSRATEEINFMQGRVGGEWDLFRITAGHERGCSYTLGAMDAEADVLSVIEGWENVSGGCVIFTTVVCRLDFDEDDRIQADRPCYGVGDVSALLPLGIGNIQTTAQAIALLMANVDTSEPGQMKVRTFQSIFATMIVATAKPKKFYEGQERIIPDVGAGYYACVFLPLALLGAMAVHIFCTERRFRIPKDGFNWFLVGQRDMMVGKNFLQLSGSNNASSSSLTVTQKPPNDLRLGITYGDNDKIQGDHYGITRQPKPLRDHPFTLAFNEANTTPQHNPSTA